MPTQYYLAWDTTALVTATPKTILELPTPANVSAVLKELVIGCDASTAGSLRIEMGTFVTTGTGTAATAQKYRGDRTIDSGITAAKVKDTVEPTTFTQGTVGAALYPGLLVPLPMYYTFQWPLSQEFAIPESTNFAIRLTLTLAAGANTMGWVSWEE
jgi:hypothetical protein